MSNPEQKSEILRYAQDDRNAALLRMTGKGRSFHYGMLCDRSVQDDKPPVPASVQQGMENSH